MQELTQEQAIQLENQYNKAIDILNDIAYTLGVPDLYEEEVKMLQNNLDAYVHPSVEMFSDWANDNGFANVSDMMNTQFSIRKGGN